MMFETGYNAAAMFAVMCLQCVNDAQDDEITMKGCDEVPMFSTRRF